MLFIGLAAACMSDAQCQTSNNATCCLFNECVSNEDIGCQGGRFEAFKYIKTIGVKEALFEIRNDLTVSKCVDSVLCPDILEVMSGMVGNTDTTVKLFQTSNTES